MEPKATKSTVRDWALWLPAVLAIPILFLLPFDVTWGEPGMGVFILFVIAYYGAHTVSMVAHELGHVAFGKMTGFKPYLVSLGNGDVIGVRKIAGLRFVFRRRPYGGYVRLDNPGSRWYRTGDFFTSLGGPLVNIALILLAWGISSDPYDVSEFRIDGNGTLLFRMAIILPNIFAVAWNLLPGKIEIGGREISNDALRILKSPFLTDAGIQVNRAFADVDRVTMNVNEDLASRGPANISSSEQYDGILARVRPESYPVIFRHHFGQAKMKPGDRRLLMDSLVTWVLFTGDESFQPEADRYSAELLAAEPDKITFKATRGGILVELGRLEEGALMLRDVFEKSEDEFDRVVAGSFLALAELKTGHRPEADEWLKKVRALGANCVPIRRIAGLLQARPPALQSA